MSVKYLVGSRVLFCADFAQECARKYTFASIKLSVNTLNDLVKKDHIDGLP